MSKAQVPFSEALEDVSRGNLKIPQSEFQSRGSVPVVDQGQRLVAGYTDNMHATVKSDLPVIVFGDHTRAIKYVDFPFAIGADGVKVLRPQGRFDAKYLYHFLRWREIPSAGYSRHFKFLKELLIPRPPLSEQRRIAAILDRADALRAKRRQILANLDNLKLSIFHDMFGDPGAASEIVRFGEIASLRAGRNLVADDAEAVAEFRVLKISSVTSGTFRPLESKPLPLGYQPPPSHLVKDGDLLMSRANTAELVGAVAQAVDPPPNLALPDKIWRFDWKDDASRTVTEFYHALFGTPAIRRQLSRLATGTGGSMKNISKARLESLELPRVARADQMAFVERARGVDIQRRNASAALRAVDDLARSIQSRAFEGEL